MSRCKMEIEMEEKINFVNSWLPQITEDEKTIMMMHIEDEGRNVGRNLLERYIDMMNPYINNEEILIGNIENITSGIIFFYISILYIMHYPNWKDHIEDVFLYNLLYVYVDNYLDDVNIEEEKKKKSMRDMLILIENEEYTKEEGVDPILCKISEIYQRFIKRCPKTREHMVNLLKLEIQSVKVQNNENLSRDEYYEIAKEKGGYTMELLYYIMNPDSENEKIKGTTYDLGVILQLLDDSLDVMIDKECKITTIATYDLDRDGKLDNLWIDIIDRISKIDKQFNLFTMIYLISAIYIPDKLSTCFSEELRSKTNKVNLFDYTRGFDAAKIITKAIIEELKIRKSIIGEIKIR